MSPSQRADGNGIVRPKRPASIKDVAREAGVSVTTVSHALSGKRPVNPETVNRIQQAGEALGYVPYAAARSLQSGKTMMIGLVIPDLSNQFFGELAAGVEECADDKNYGVVLCASKADSKRETRYLNLLRTHSIDGLIYTAGSANWYDELPAFASQYPIVLADEYVTGLDSVPLIAADHYQGGQAAGRHLAQLGHRRAVVICGPRGLRSTDDRLRGFKESFPNAIVQGGDFSEASGAAATLALLTADKTFSALFAMNDLMAFGAVQVLTRVGLRVPQDVSVVGFDDVAFSARVTPALTTVRQPASVIGREAAGALIGSLVTGRRGQRRGSKVLPVELVARDSTAPYTRHSWPALRL